MAEEADGQLSELRLLGLVKDERHSGWLRLIALCVRSLYFNSMWYSKGNIISDTVTNLLELTHQEEPS